MFYWTKDKSNLDKLQKRYCRLMKNAYNLAIKNKEKSDLLHEEASKLLIEIKKLQHQS
ncbi:Lacal_2735 family protein [Aquimarina sp. MMG015]|uniref:Lacal_2735 family protein n=1 Tax=Aquimarina TaxID=290174 RepID=UPI0004193ECF|nr:MULTISPECIES: Lacal_2735 family protein [Aquimarina]AXT56208.1 Lacal_2735 family protein [Aquimarina sp. AD1]MBQ4803694.1 Lacal_2735 family protein [Aquimarina sp. MMG015]RKN34226.1 Lacal_2735 family protein [Aquimarina sp. AD1]